MHIIISVLQYIIMQVITTKSIHIIIQELMNLLHGNTFSACEDFFDNPFSSVLTNYVRVHVRILVQVLVEAHAVDNELE